MPTEGQRAINKKTGETAVFTNGQWVKSKAGAVDAGMRGRLSLGLGPMVQAQSDLSQVEAAGNPYSLTENPGNALAKTLQGVGVPGTQFHPFDGIAKSIGGQDFQNYEQAAKAFESQLMPIMSGAAVSPSEAARQIKAALPELGDSPETLQRKSRARQMMLNGAAHSMGAPLPYPDVPTFGVNAGAPPKPATKADKNQALKAKSENTKTGGFKILGVEP